MKKNTNLIYYFAGCYGTFVEWVCTTLSDGSTNADSPYTENGSSHNFIGNPLWIPGKLFADIESDNNLAFARCHPVIFQQANSLDIAHNNSYLDIVRQDLSFLEKHYNKILVLHPTPTTRLWQENNFLQKVTMNDELYNSGYSAAGYSKEFLSELFQTDFNARLIETLRKEIGDMTMNWNKPSIHDMDTWELRELVSSVWFDRSKDLFSCWDNLAKEFLDIKFISLDCFRNNFCDGIIEILDYFDVKQPPEGLINNIEADWRPRQNQIDKDKYVNLIVDSMVDKFYYNWNDIELTIIDEAYVLRKLYDKGIKIKSYNLNKFPTNTEELSSLIKS